MVRGDYIILLVWAAVFCGGMAASTITLAFPCLWPWSAETWGLMFSGVVIGGLVTAPVLLLD